MAKYYLGSTVWKNKIKDVFVDEEEISERYRAGVSDAGIIIGVGRPLYQFSLNQMKYFEPREVKHPHEANHLFDKAKDALTELGGKSPPFFAHNPDGEGIFKHPRGKGIIATSDRALFVPHEFNADGRKFCGFEFKGVGWHSTSYKESLWHMNNFWAVNNPEDFFHRRGGGYSKKRVSLSGGAFWTKCVDEMNNLVDANDFGINTDLPVYCYKLPKFEDFFGEEVTENVKRECRDADIGLFETWGGFGVLVRAVTSSIRFSYIMPFEEGTPETTRKQFLDTIHESHASYTKQLCATLGTELRKISLYGRTHVNLHAQDIRANGEPTGFLGVSIPQESYLESFRDIFLHLLRNKVLLTTEDEDENIHYYNDLTAPFFKSFFKKIKEDTYAEHLKKTSTSTTFADAAAKLSLEEFS